MTDGRFWLGSTCCRGGKRPGLFYECVCKKTRNLEVSKFNVSRCSCGTVLVAAVLAIRDLRQCSGATSRRRNETNPFSTTDPCAAGWEMLRFSILSCGTGGTCPGTKPERQNPFSGKAGPPHRCIDKRTLQHWWREKAPREGERPSLSTRLFSSS